MIMTSLKKRENELFKLEQSDGEESSNLAERIFFFFEKYSKKKNE